MRHHPMTARHPEKVLFASADELAYAQIASAWFSVLAEPRKAVAVLGVAGIPMTIAPEVVAAMRETDIDLKGLRPRLLTPVVLDSADLVITMGATVERLWLGTHVPVYREHWVMDVASVDGPRSHGTGRARSLRDLIRARVAMLVFTEGWARADISGEEARVTRPRWHTEASPAF